MIDGHDIEILKILQQNARTSNAEIARQLGMAPSAILERIRKLEARGVIRGYEARIEPAALGLNLLAYVFVRSEEISGENGLGERLVEIPGVQEVHHIAGEDCYLVKVRATDARSLGRLLREGFGSVRTRTTIVLETLRESTHLPLPAAEATEAAEETPEAPEIPETALQTEARHG
ncbi:MAG TPA: Lrp/AsnC family transcriptional regulator [Thermoanaerobaculia bacterium]|nr:Lrp/AsnC family transcriptional regulator [Thermoanaerobaculia bacterium]